MVGCCVVARVGVRWSTKRITGYSDGCVWVLGGGRLRGWVWWRWGGGGGGEEGASGGRRGGGGEGGGEGGGGGEGERGGERESWRQEDWGREGNRKMS